VLLVLAAPLSSEAQETAHRRPVVLVLVRAAGRADNAALGALIADSIKLELTAHAIDVVTAPESLSDSATGDSEAAALAGRNGADFAFWVTYAQADSDIQLKARWTEPKKDQASASASRTGPLDFSFDAMVANLVDEIVEGQKDRIASLPAPAQEATPVQTPESVPAALPAAIAPAAESKPEPKIAPLAFSLGSAPFIATFTALGYFQVGLTVTLSGMYRIKVPGGLMGFGAVTGVSGLHGKGAYTSADFYLVPIGAEFQYGTRTGSLIDFFVTIQGGPALFTLKPQVGNPLTKVIAFALGGLGILISLYDNVGLSIDGSYTCFFDSPPIMGFAPSLSVLVRF